MGSYLSVVWRPWLVAIFVGYLAAQLGPLLADARLRFDTDDNGLVVLATAWVLAHTLTQVPGGRLAQRLHPGYLLPASCALAVGATGMLAVASTLTVAVLARLLVGVGTGIAFVTGVSLLGTHRELPELGVARGTYGALVNVGVTLGLVIPPALQHAIGWSHGLGVQAALLAGLAFAVWDRQAAPSGRPPPQLWSDLRRVSTTSVARMSAAHFVGFGTYVAVFTWAVVDIGNRFDLSPSAAAQAVMAVSLMAIVGRLGGAALRMRFGPVTLIHVSVAGTIAGLFTMAWAPSLVAAIMALVVVCLASNLPFSTVFGPDLAPSDVRPTALGIVSLAGNVGGLVAVVSFGLISERAETFGSGWGGLWALMTLVGIGIVALGRRNGRRGHLLVR